MPAIWDLTARTYTETDETGAVLTTRPYTPDENAAADAYVAAQIPARNVATLEAQAAAAMRANRDYLALASPSNAQAVAQVRHLTQVTQALARLVLHQTEDTT